MYKKLWNGLLALILITATGCHVKTGGILISEIGTCREVDEKANVPKDITNIFSSHDEQVVLYFYLDTELDVRFEYRWHYEGELGYSHTASQNNENGYNFAWLGAKEGEQLPIGNYRVDIVWGDTVIRSTGFRVEE